MVAMCASICHLRHNLLSLSLSMRLSAFVIIYFYKYIFFGEKVKKTLDFWEQGTIYNKDMVQYVKKSFMKSRESAAAANETKGLVYYHYYYYHSMLTIIHSRSCH
ncbi:hypothetical protein K501DRAFT_75412 [Backusella circina FSU 941]|nr:hypothetical protein K501DRAFT_75412 [Backusella circina FSU 941]